MKFLTIKFFMTVILSSIFLNVCLGQSYKLQGKVNNLKSDSLLIVKFKGNSIESVKIKVNQSAFVYEDTISEPYFIQILKIKNGTNETYGKLADILAEQGSIKIVGKNDSYDSIKVTGSKSDFILKKYLRKDKMLSKKWDSLKLMYDVYVSKSDTVNRKKVAKEMNKITLEERVSLLKKYVRKYSNEIIGALIPNFCTLKEILNKEDYVEIFNYLSDKIKITSYGQSIYARTQ